MAQGLLTKMVTDANLGVNFKVDSAGTANWNTGLPPDSRAISASFNRGIDISGLRARQVCKAEIANHDYILAMDKRNLRDLIKLADGAGCNTKHIKLFMAFSDKPDVIEVPDPYHCDESRFYEILEMFESASRGLLKYISKSHGRN